MKDFPDKSAASTFLTDTQDNSESATTIAAVDGELHVIDEITVGYSGSPSAVKAFTVTFGGTKKFEIDFPAATIDPVVIPFIRGLYNAKNEAVVLTLPASGTGGIKGYVNVSYR